MPDDLEKVIRYHQATKHRLNAYARGPGRLDWANQPDPFRRYIGAPLIRLERKGHNGPEVERPAPLNARSVSKLFFNSLAISAWKRSGTSTWSLRVNPSSGNLHPTEGYLISGPVVDLSKEPAIFHYAPDEHGLELLGSLDPAKWSELGLPKDAFLIVLSSIYWRESWKYGERAFRYCLIDSGHAMAVVSIAASCLGWQAALLEDTGTRDLEKLLEFKKDDTRESEHPECIIAVFANGEMRDIALGSDALSGLRAHTTQSRPNALSLEHVNWPAIEEARRATIKPFTQDIYGRHAVTGEVPFGDPCKLLRLRRSAQVFDAEAVMEPEQFFGILEGILPERTPLNLLPWKPFVHLALFVHSVEGIDRGIYMLIRDGSQKKAIEDALSAEFLWEKPADCPSDIDLYLLIKGDARGAAKQTSCGQDIASDGCFCSAMLAQFEQPLREFGSWFYSRLHWECGIIGQALYLDAEESGFRGCGMGCYFDDSVHSLLGLNGIGYQDLYHFAVGKPLEDPRITTLPAYL